MQQEPVSVVAMGLFVVFMLMLSLHGARAKTPCYPAMFVFGDSLSDTGNGPLTNNPLFLRTTMRPYGETEPGQPASRFSDGYLIVDYIASYMRLPFLNPYLNSTADFTSGINFAVSGATALNLSTLATYGIIPLTRDSLDVQLDWYQDFKASVPAGGAPGKPSASAFAHGLYVMLIGQNDYTGAFQSLYSPAYVNTTILPKVIQKIKDATETLYDSGARNFLFISITPLGCSPSYLATFGLLLPKDSDGCLPDYNSVAYNHGASLRNAVRSLRITYPAARFVFADYYGALSNILKNKTAYGFSNTLDACCGAPPPVPYRYSLATFCNVLSNTLFSTLCSNPNLYINWDGIHYTNQCNQNVATLFTSGRSTYLHPSDGLTC